MRKVMLAIVVAASTLAVGCAAPIEAACNKAEECGELGDRTAEQCIAEGNKIVDDYRAKEKVSCDKIADAFESIYDCVSGLSCADLKKDVDATDCKQAETDAEAVFKANAEDCGVE